MGLCFSVFSRRDWLNVGQKKAAKADKVETTVKECCVPSHTRSENGFKLDQVCEVNTNVI